MNKRTKIGLIWFFILMLFILLIEVFILSIVDIKLFGFNRLNFALLFSSSILGIVNFIVLKLANKALKLRS